MPKEYVLDQYHERGRVQKMSGTDGFIISQRNSGTGEYETIGMLQFANGKLISATKFWYSGYSEDSIEGFLAKFFMLVEQRIPKEGRYAKIEHHSVKEPNYTSHTFLAVINFRTIRFSINDYKGTKTVQIEEELHDLKK
jgi:hypothetical protein